MQIRPACADDLPALARLNDEVHALHVAGAPERYRVPTSDEVERWFEDVLGADGTALLCAADGDRLLGYLLLRRSRTPANLFLHERGFAHVDQICVTAAERGQGAGRALMEAAEALARSWNLPSILLDVTAFNPAAARFYEAIGYRPTGVRYGKPL